MESRTAQMMVKQYHRRRVLVDLYFQAASRGNEATRQQCMAVCILRGLGRADESDYHIIADGFGSHDHHPTRKRQQKVIHHAQTKSR